MAFVILLNVFRGGHLKLGVWSLLYKHFNPREASGLCILKILGFSGTIYENFISYDIIIDLEKNWIRSNRDPENRAWSNRLSELPRKIDAISHGQIFSTLLPRHLKTESRTTR